MPAQNTCDELLLKPWTVELNSLRYLDWDPYYFLKMRCWSYFGLFYWILDAFKSKEFHFERFDIFNF